MPQKQLEKDLHNVVSNQISRLDTLYAHLGLLYACSRYTTSAPVVDLVSVCLSATIQVLSPARFGNSEVSSRYTATPD